MSLNSIAQATKYTSELDKIITGASVTGFLCDNVLRAKFVGAKTVIVPDIDFVGLADYDRENGYSKGKTTVANKSFTLSKDRGRKFQIDREEMDESGILNLAGQILGEFARTKVSPEIDAYVLSSLAKVAADNGHTTEFDSTKVFEQLVATINAVQSRAGFNEELVAFVNPTAYAALMSSDSITKQLEISAFKQGEINLNVKSLNGVAIIPVADDRMKTEFVFDEGASTTAGGVAPSAEADDICILVLPKRSASLVKKTETMRIFTPEQNPDADAYVFNYRLYYDVFVKKSGMGLIEAVIASK